MEKKERRRLMKRRNRDDRSLCHMEFIKKTDDITQNVVLHE
jgi:hypothetical protein